MDYMVLAPTTDAATKVQINTFGMESLVISASALAITERVNLFRNVAGTWVPVVSAAGAAIELAPVGTGNGPSYSLPGGAIYGFDKDATASPCAVSIAFVPLHPA